MLNGFIFMRLEQVPSNQQSIDEFFRTGGMIQGEKPKRKSRSKKIIVETNIISKDGEESKAKDGELLDH